MSDEGADNRQRIDIWLYRARFFKTRSQATQCVESGKVRLTRSGQTQRVGRASFLVSAHDELVFKRGQELIRLRITDIGERRGPAQEARTLYEHLNPDLKKRD